MPRPSYIILHRTEWERIKQKNKSPEAKITNKNEYLQALTDKSQEWIHSWPDSVQGHVTKIQKQKEKLHAKKISLAKQYRNLKKQLCTDDANDAIKKARQLIFQDSCYGRRLLSALIESKTLEERDVQVIFLNKLKKEAAKMDKLKPAPDNCCTFGLDKMLEDKKQQRKLASLECNRVNNAMKLAKKNKEMEEKEVERRMMADTEVTEQMVFNEEKQNETMKQLEKDAVYKYVNEQKQLKEEKLKREKQDDKLTESCRVEQDKKQCNINRIINESHKNRQETEQFKKNYKLIEIAKDNEEKRYDFIDKRIKEEEIRLDDIDRENVEKRKKQLKERIAEAERNKAVGACKQRLLEDDCKNACCRQCMIPQCARPSKECDCQKKEGHAHNLEFLNPEMKLLKQQKEREKEQPAWSGGAAAHEQFAAEANKTASECIYKLPVKKVIDDYMRLNCLESLPST